MANRACAPASKLYCHEQWLKEDVHIEGTQELALHQLYRAMDFLEANKETIEQAIFYQVADLLNLDVDNIFYDTTSPHFEIDDEDQANAHGSIAAGRKAYRAPRKRPQQERPWRRAANRGGTGGHPRRLSGVPLGVSRQHRRCHHR